MQLVVSMFIMVFAAENAVTLAKNGLYAWEKEKERVSSLLLEDDLFEVLSDQVFQQFFPVNAGDHLPCAVVVGDVGRVLGQYVTNNLAYRIIPLLFQGIVHLHDPLFSHCLIQLHHLMHRIPQNTENANPNAFCLFMERMHKWCDHI